MRRWLILAVALLAIAGCSSSDKSSNMGPGGVTPEEFEFLIGTWLGTWDDTRYNVQGTLQATFAVSGNDVTATGVIGLQSLGLGDEAGTAMGTIDGDDLDFTFTAATVGSGSGAATATSGSGTGSVVGALNFGDFTFQGTVTSTTMDGLFDFTSPTGGNGVARLTKQ